ncbi:MAG: sigma-54-dependent Fis family transcriptional regulator [Bacteroidales bacterium]|nr:sigma-54-dependent Fis family transcriptional regulator [Candidatus Cryptobacteroides equifaecalis]
MDFQELQKIKNKYDIIGNDAELNRAIETALAVAPTDLAVLISGESGVGKDAIPQIIHQNSRRRTGKYLAVNCGAIPPGTINAELFGHEKGAFTGAIGERKGYFEEANGGTLFLDEIGELPRETQALLLRVLQNGEYMKVGSSKIEKTDVRVICATNVNLNYAVATGKFREDLYYRLNGIQINVPALRERNKDDIYLLFRKFSSDFAEKFNLCKISLSHDAINMLTSYRWPGNIRELKNKAEAITGMKSRPVSPGYERLEIGAAALAEFLPADQDALLPSIAAANAGQGSISDNDKQQIIKAILDLKQEVDRLKQIVASGTMPQSSVRTEAAVPGLMDYSRPEPEEQQLEPEPQAPAELSIRKMGDEMIFRCLAKHGGKVKPAAAELGISERTIYRKLAEKKA